MDLQDGGAQIHVVDHLVHAHPHEAARARVVARALHAADRDPVDVVRLPDRAGLDGILVVDAVMPCWSSVSRSSRSCFRDSGTSSARTWAAVPSCGE